MYLVPAKAELKEYSDLKDKCLSHHELFGLLKTELEDKTHVKILPRHSRHVSRFASNFEKKIATTRKQPSNPLGGGA